MIFYKGKKVLEMVDTHYEAVVNSFRHFSQFMTEYLENGAGEAAEELRRQIDQEEKQADSTRHAVVREFLNGGLLAQTRAELLRVVELTDGVANQCQDLSRRIIYEKVRFPEELKGDVLEMVRLTQEQLDVLSQAIEALFSNYDQLLRDNSLLDSVKHYEELVDDRELCMIKRIFEMEIPLAEKSHLRYFISRVADISDLIEDIGDAVQVMVVLRKV